MIVPQFWAEARLQRPRARNQSQITVRRFGWSDLSQSDAQRMADERVRAALQRIVSGANLPRREPKVGYGGAAGLPIREEVLSRHGDVVITRNSYGAQCLNTPDVLFADIDLPEFKPSGCGPTLLIAVVLFGMAMVAGWDSMPRFVGVMVAVGIFVIAHYVVRVIDWRRRRSRPDPASVARARIDRFAQGHPDWHLRIYQTPAGFRLLAMHRMFAPDDPAVAECFTALGVDPVYQQMCRNQACFRARLTPKPWRIGVSHHLKPRPGVWPVNPAKLPERAEWIQRYEQAAAGFAACRFVDAIGSGVTAAKVATVCELHDRLSQALSGRAIA